MIGRTRELQELNELYNSGKAEFAVVYGRRRVGKTYLVDEAFENRFAFRHAGLSPVDLETKGLMKKQLEQFFYSLKNYGMKETRKPKSWMEAFYMLEVLLQNKDDGSRQVVFLDELPWMDTHRSGFVTAFEGFWNNWACHRKNLMVIACGSATSWILNKLINNHGGLYGRVTYEIKLEPFTLRECEEFLEEKGVMMSRYDITQSYMMLGGIPYYLGYFRKELSLAQNIDELFFAKNAKLKYEFDRLFKSIFDNPELMKSIVKLLHNKNAGYTRGEISKALNMKDGETLGDCLNALISSNFAVKYVPFGCRKNDYHYKLTDPFCMFYLRFVNDHYSLTGDFWLSNIDSQPIVSWRGLAYENVCFNHIGQIKKALGISGVSTTQSAWSKKKDDEEGTQIDLLIERKDNITNMCEIKFYSGFFSVDSNYYRKLLERHELLLRQLNMKMSVHNTLITTYGLKQNKYSSICANTITMDDLFE